MLTGSFDDVPVAARGEGQRVQRIDLLINSLGELCVILDGASEADGLSLEFNHKTGRLNGLFGDGQVESFVEISDPALIRVISTARSALAVALVDNQPHSEWTIRVRQNHVVKPR